MAEITSKAAGPRLLNVKEGKDGVTQVAIQPGETVDVELSQPDHPAIRALFDSGELVHGRPKDKVEAEANAKAAELKAEYDRGFKDGQAAAKNPPKQS